MVKKGSQLSQQNHQFLQCWLWSIHRLMAVKVASQVCLVLLALASLCVPRVSSHGEEEGERHVFCVKPDSNSVTNTDPNCHYLSYYVANSSRYFQNNTVFKFQTGIHYLSGDLSVSGVHSLELVGESSVEHGEHSSQIHCPLADIGSMVFFNVQNLTISHLLFSGCSGYLDMTGHWIKDPHATLALIYSQDVCISHTVIQNVTGVGLFGVNVQGRSLVSNSAMLFNRGNSTRDGGNVYFLYTYHCLKIPTELVIENTLVYGGSSDIFWVVSSPSGLTLFVKNCNNVSITVRGCNITRNAAHSGMGGNVQLALVVEDNYPNVNVTFEDTSITDGFSTSFGPGGGGGMYVFSSVPQYVHNTPIVNITGCVFSGNKADVGGALYMYGTPPLTFVTNTTFENNLARKSGGAVFLDRIGMYSDSVDYYEKFWMGEVVFRENTAVFGGAFALSLASTISFIPNTTTSFTANVANDSGGAIYTSPQSQYPTCFVSLPCDIHNTSCSYRVLFSQNTVTYSGTDVYLTRDQSLLCGIMAVPQPVDQALHLNNSEKHHSRITSGTTSVYVCVDGVSQLHMNETHINSYPGKTFNISAITIGYSNGTTYGSVLANVTTKFGNARIPPLQRLQRIRSLQKCCNLSYTVTSTNGSGNVTLTLTSETPLDIAWGIQVKVNMTGCPRGFQMQGRECGCVDLLRQHGVNCDVQRGTVFRPSRNVWIGFIDGGVVYYTACPYDYCKKTQQELDLSSSDYPMNQCASNREGLLCSQCPANYSLGLGTSACLPDCSSISLLLIIPFALAGISLVLFLIVVDLTISKGCLNSIIFYANIVWLNNDIYLPPGTPAVFKVFIAWINLSLGIKTCFYRGMDTYSKVWLMFVFPVYLWGIMLFMYVMSSWSSFFTKLIRKNSVQVLATLFLLSCTKLLQSIVTTFSFGHLTLPHGTERTVWFPDATIVYFSPHHMALVFVGVFFLLLHIPYVLFLLLGHCLVGTTMRSCIRRHRLRLLTFSEAYTGTFRPYRKPWIGLLVVVRIFLLAVYAFNYKNEVAINLVCTGAVTVFLLLGMIVLRGLYEKWYLDVLEAAMLFNLWCFSVSTLYTQDIPGAQNIIVSISVGMTLLIFLLIVTVLLYKQLPERYKVFRSLLQRVLRTMGWKKNKEYREIESMSDETSAFSSKRLSFSFTRPRELEQ